MSSGYVSIKIYTLIPKASPIASRNLKEGAKPSDASRRNLEFRRGRMVFRIPILVLINEVLWRARRDISFKKSDTRKKLRYFIFPLLQ